MPLALYSAAISFAPAMHVAAATRAAAAPQMGYSWSTPGVGAIWDPLGLAKTPAKFERLRYVEVKHGRIAMLAVLAAAVLAMGLWPRPFTDVSEASVRALLDHVAISKIAE